MVCGEINMDLMVCGETNRRGTSWCVVRSIEEGPHGVC